MRDFALLAAIARLDDDVLIGAEEVAMLLGLSVTTVQQRKVNGLRPMESLRKLRWRLGDVRAWIRSRATV